MPNNEWGDFQTPPALVDEIVALLGGRQWNRVLEPTCGVGNFVRGATSFHPQELIGLEVNSEYASQVVGADRVICADIFKTDLRALPWQCGGPLLVLGNPPWVTNSQLSTLGSKNLPVKSNVRNLKGIDALTGSSNFDITEFIWLKLLIELEGESPTIALLCKTQVARNVLSYCQQFGLPLKGSKLYRLDAKAWFGAAVDACLFVVELAQGSANYTCEVFESLQASSPLATCGLVQDRFVADVVGYEATRFADGESPLTWRQGVKHDAASVMELRREGDSLSNTEGAVDVEEEFVFPLLKCTDVFKGTAPTRAMIVPQRSLSDDTELLAEIAPRLWRYLLDHEDQFTKRKSSIYLKRPRFCVFGLGPYTFAPYKVAISGLHKEPRFRLVPPEAGKPVVFDDTCYILPFDDLAEAAIAHAVLDSVESHGLLTSIVFWDAKRPVTKKILQRVDLLALAEPLGAAEVMKAAGNSLAAIGDREAVDLSSGFQRVMERWGTRSKENGSPHHSRRGRGMIALPLPLDLG